MRSLKLDEVKEGMILASPIMMGETDIELLSKGIEITARHIELMERLEIREVSIVDSEDDIVDVVLSDDDQIEVIKKSAESAGEDFDEEKYREELEKILISKDEFEPSLRNITNKNMVINVLTGEGNIPIDEKHKDLIEHTERAFEKLKTSNELDLDSIKNDIDNALPDMVRNSDVLMRLSQLKETDDYTFDHSLRVSILATMIGKWLDYSSEQLSELAQAALLFDIGKLKLPEFILSKKGKVTDDEFEVIKKHSQFGYHVLLKTEGVTNDIKYSALQHHERMDGSGYPLRLKSGQIHEFAKIIMVCDIFDAMTNERPYKKKVSPFVAAEYIKWNAGVTLDAKVCYIFLQNLAEFFTGKQVLLNTLEIGTIIFVDINFPTKPVVNVEGKFIDLAKDKRTSIIELYN